MVGNSPTLTIEIEGVQVPRLLDTGSEITTITEDFYNQYFKHSTLLGSPNFVKIYAANGTILPCLGYFQTEIV